MKKTRNSRVKQKKVGIGYVPDGPRCANCVSCNRDGKCKRGMFVTRKKGWCPGHKFFLD